MFVRTWLFVVVPEHEAEFVREYAADGSWARLFARADGFAGTTLEPVADRPHAYRTIDRWRSAADFAAFLTRYRAEYQALDERCIAWTSSEELESEEEVEP